MDDDQFVLQPEVDAYDARAERWSTPKAPMPRARWIGSASTVGSVIVIAAGAKPVPPYATKMPGDYLAVLADLKRRVVAARTQAALAANHQLIAPYWHVGRTIVPGLGRASCQ